MPVRNTADETSTYRDSNKSITQLHVAEVIELYLSRMTHSQVRLRVSSEHGR
jgi:hypothetical protein